MRPQTPPSSAAPPCLPRASVVTGVSRGCGTGHPRKRNVQGSRHGPLPLANPRGGAPHASGTAPMRLGGQYRTVAWPMMFLIGRNPQ